MPSDRVKEFYDFDSFAIIGMSQSKKNFAWSLYEELSKRGKRIYPIHPKGGRRGKIQFYTSFGELPEVPEGVIVSADLRNTQGLLEALKESGVKAIWFQQGCFDKAVIDRATSLGLDPIKGCAHMYMPGGAGIHRFHRVINDILGKGYK